MFWKTDCDTVGMKKRQIVMYRKAGNGWAMLTLMEWPLLYNGLEPQHVCDGQYRGNG